MVFLNAPKEHHGASAKWGHSPFASKWGQTSGNRDEMPVYARVLKIRRGHVPFDHRPPSWIDRLVRV